MIWDRNDWQGKSKNQLKYSYYVVLVSGLLLMVVGFILFVSKL